MMKIPKEVQETVFELEKNGFEAYVVGGCVRDLLLKKEPEDWDIATDATPEEIQKIFPNNFYDNQFFTVTVLTESQDPRLKEIEITTYRAELRYLDHRHPSQVKYAETIQEDLSRRDFTINAIALKLISPVPGKPLRIEILDPFWGQKDLKAKVIRAVGNPDERFREDALRMLRAIRFAVTLEFGIEEKTYFSLKRNAVLLQEISKERIRDEFIKIIMSKRAAEGIEMLRETGLLDSISPELKEGWGVSQNKHHIYNVWEHNLNSLRYAVEKNWGLHVRLAALFHDVAKPRTKIGEGPDATFYGHEVVGAKMVQKILSRLHFPQKDIEKIAKLIRYHMFYYNVGEVTESSVRKLVSKVGPKDMEELLQLRMADRIGSGVPKAEPYKLRHLRYLIEKVSRDPLSPKMLKLKGNDVMEILGITPGPKVGWILELLLKEVLNDPQKNTEEYLTNKIKELGRLQDSELQILAKEAKAERDAIEMRRDEMTKQKYWVT